MNNKGIDVTFVHQGIRQDDLAILEIIAKEQGIDFDWVQSLLKNFHEKKVKNPEIEEKEIAKLIEEHLQKINR